MKLPKGFGGQVLYLDYDGVLHHENVWFHPESGPFIRASSEYTLFQNVGLLQELLAPFPSVRIVLSTTWVRRYGVTRAAKCLPAALRERVIAGTFHSHMDEDDFAEKPRGVQVYEDVLRRKPARWLAVDDDTEGWPASHAERVVLTHPHRGISEPEVLEELKRKLLEQFGPAVRTGGNGDA